MAAGQTFGEGQERRLDRLTVSMPHPDAAAALLSGNSYITAHFATPPYHALELKNPRIHAMLTSNDILGGPAPAVILCTTQRFYGANRELMETLISASEDAVAWIAAHPPEAAQAYLRAEPQRMSVEDVQELLGDNDIQFTTTPANTFKIAQFMRKLGRLKKPLQGWRDFFFPIARGNGS
jgi:NitT/TauT family transport system substrate-binding protein